MAVLPVVFYHAAIPGPSGGYIGVDVFFVISGFLITRIVADEIARGTFSLTGFYERRARRILPALTAVVAGTLAMGWILLLPGELRDLGRSALAAALFLSNVFFQQTLNYFDGGEFAPLLHTWSLAVEEQFYLFFPPLLALLIGRSGRRTAIKVVVLLSFLSLAFAVALLPSRPSAVFFLIFYRAWELGIGALLALASLPVVASRSLREALGGAGLLAILVPVFAYDTTTPFPGLAALVPVLGAAGLIYVGGLTGGSTVSRLLSLRPIVWVGLVSYSLYLWHWPIMVYLRVLTARAVLSVEVGLVAVAASVLCAWLSYRYVERPLRRKPPEGFGRKPVFALSLAGIAAMVVAGGTFWAMDGAPHRMPESARKLADARLDLRPGSLACFQKLPADGLCEIGAPAADASPMDFLIWGDSHAVVMLAGLDATAKAAGKRGLVAGKTACPPVWDVRELPGLPACARLNASIHTLLAERSDLPLVILAARWPLWVEGRGFRGEWNGRVRLEWVGAAEAHPAGGDNAAILNAGLERTIAAIRATGREVVLVGSVPEVGWHVPNELARRAMLGLPDPPGITRKDVQQRSARTEAILQTHAAAQDGVRYIPLTPAFCASDTCSIRDTAGVPLYIDDDHITRTASETLLRDALARIWSERDTRSQAALSGGAGERALGRTKP